MLSGTSIAIEAINLTLTVQDEYKNENEIGESNLIKCQFLYEFFKHDEITKVLEEYKLRIFFIEKFNLFFLLRNEKTLDAILLKLHTFLISECINDKIVTKILQIFIELSDKVVFANKIYTILFKTESLVKKTKQLLKMFNDMNLNYDDLFKKYLKLSKFSIDRSTYFPYLCKFLINFFNVRR